MAITRRWQTGFEEGTLDVADGGVSGGISTTSQRTGLYCNQFARNAPGYYRYKNIPATRQVRYGLAWYSDGWINANVGQICALRANTTLLVQLRVDYVGPYADFYLYVGGVLRDTQANYLDEDKHYHIGIDAKIDPSSGWVNVYVDGDNTPVLSYSGDTGDSDINNISWGPLYDMGTNGTEQFRYDDIYVDDSTGEGSASSLDLLRFYWTYPDGAGNYTQFTPSAGANYQCVDERPPSDGDYVSEDTVDQFDSYTMTTVAIGGGQTIEAVIPVARVQRQGAAEEIALGTRYSSTDLVGSDQDPDWGGYGHLWERQTTKPGGGAWDQTALDGFEFLMKSRGTF